MKTILFSLHELGHTAIDLGKQGENKVREIDFDLRDWVAEYPEASAALYISQPNTTVYLAATKMEDGILKWPIINTYTATPGFGNAEIVLSGKDGERLKSATASIFVSESMSEDEQGEAPEYMKPYADQVAENAAKVEKAVEEIKGIVVQSGNMPTGGTAGDALVKQSNAYGDAAWKTLTASDVGALPSDGTAVNANALNGKDAEYYATAESVNQLSEQMAALQSGVEIVPTVSGNVITLNDASNLPLRGMTIYGKTTQNGTPTPDAPVELVTVGSDGTINEVVVGKNLINVASIKDGYWAGDVFKPGNDYWGYIVIPVLAGGTLYASGFPAVSGVTPVYLRSPDPYDVLRSMGINSSKINGVHQIPSDVSWIGLCFSKNEQDISQIYASTVDSVYAPYAGQSLIISTPNGLSGIPVTSDGNYTDANGQQWICDEIDLERGVRIKRTERFGVNEFAAVAFSGDPNWHDSTKTFSYEIILPNVAKPKENALGLCNLAPSYSFGDFYEKGIVDGVMNDKEYLVINLAISRGIDTIDKFKAWCAEKGFAVLKALRYPEETQLPEFELAAYRALATNKPHTTIYNDAGCDQTVRYVADTQLYIDKQIGASAAAVNALMEGLTDE